MDPTRHATRPNQRAPAGRPWALAAMTLVFAIAASVLGPFASSARPRAEQEGGLVRADGGRRLGQALGRQYRLIVCALPGGARYTVTTSDGRVLARDLPASDVYRRFPDLDPGALHTGAADGRLMMVDPDR